MPVIDRLGFGGSFIRKSVVQFLALEFNEGPLLPGGIYVVVVLPRENLNFPF